MRLYTFNYNYFDKIDIEEKAYWLGFMYADGYLTAQGGFGCALKAGDKEHLVKFLTSIEINDLDCLKYQERSNSYRFQIMEHHFYERLLELGFTVNKSYDNTDLIWSFIPKQLKKDFIRGFFDGDGYVTFSKNGMSLIGVVSNNEELLQTFSSYINDTLNIKDFSKVQKSEKDPYPRIRFSAYKAKQCADLLYKNATCYLDRKYKNYLNFKDHYLSNKQYKYIKKLNSGRFYIYIPNNGKKETVGTFDTVKEAIKAFNLKAEEYNLSPQNYINENLFKVEDKEED